MCAQQKVGNLQSTHTHSQLEKSRVLVVAFVTKKSGDRNRPFTSNDDYDDYDYDDGV